MAYGLSVRRGVLLRDGKPYRGIGVNYFDLFLRSLTEADPAPIAPGLAALAERKIPFVRFCACGFWPKDFALYRTDKPGYFARFDAVVHAAEAAGIGLIPSLFWHLPAVPDLVGEPCDQWGDPRSRTHAWMRRYVEEIVTRYRSSPALWGWEFGNEYDLAADLPNAAEHRPQLVPELGTPTTRSARDEFTHAILRTALTTFGKEVRRWDKTRVVLSGNSIPRRSAWHQEHAHSWEKDTTAQFQENLRASNPDPLDLLTVHAYEPDDFARLGAAAQAARAARKPLFVGEFGVGGPATPENQRRFQSQLDTLSQERVPLAAVWVYDFKGQDDLTITATNARAYQLEALVAANREWAPQSR